MSVGFWIVGVAAVVVATGYGALRLSVAVGRRRRDRHIQDLLSPVSVALAQGRTPSIDAIRALAIDPLTRNHLGEALSAAGQLGLFPAEFLTPEALAESDIAVWLAHPHELGTVPRTLDCTGQVPRSIPEAGQVVYFLFRFRMDSPHPAARDGVMAAVAGPYILDGDAVLYRGASTRSYFEAYASRTPDEHVDRVHRAVLSGSEVVSIKATMARVAP